jgi:hypothetical protein
MALIMQGKAIKPTPQVEMDVEVAATPEEAVHKVFVQTPTVTEVEALTMEYIELYRKFDYFEVKALVKRMEEIRKQLQTIANETMDDKKPAIFTCAQGEMEFSERGKATDVPHPLALIQALTGTFGPAVAESVIDIAITPLRKILSEYELQKYLTEHPGARTLRSVRPVPYQP